MILWVETLAISTCLDEEWVHRHVQMMLWGETLAIFTCLDEEVGQQISPNYVVG